MLFHSHGIGIQTKHFNNIFQGNIGATPHFYFVVHYFNTLAQFLSLSLFLSHTQMHTHTLCVSHAPSINGTLAPTHQHTCTHTCTHKDMYALTRTHTHVSIVWYTAVNFVLQHQSQPHDSFFRKGSESQFWTRKSKIVEVEK